MKSSYPNPEREQLRGLCADLIKSILAATNNEDLLEDMLVQLDQDILPKYTSGSALFGTFDFLDELTLDRRYVK